MNVAHPVERYQPGGTLGCCDRCAFVKRLAELKFEWTGLRVCADCWDPRPPDLSPPSLTPEGMPVRNARPDLGDTLGPNLTTADDL